MMVILIVESVPPGLRGELSKWMLEPKAGVFVGTISAAVRDLLWQKACQEAGAGGCTMIYQTNTEQGFAIRSWGDTTREVEEWEGLFLVRRPKRPLDSFLPGTQLTAAQPMDWSEYLHPEIWAKTARGVQLKETEGRYHPLSCHMIDTAMVALRIWKYILPLPLREQIRKQLGVQTEGEAGCWFAFFAGLHDLGKATPAFAHRCKWPEGWAVLTRMKYEGLGDREPVAHDMLTAFLLEDLLAAMGLPTQAAVPVARVVGAHHGLLPHPEELQRAERCAGSGRWRNAREHLVKLLAHVTGVEHLARPQCELWEAGNLLLILAGLTSVSDWIASNHDYFPFAGAVVRLPQYARRARWQAWIALHQLGWFLRPGRMASRSFQELFDRVPNRLQEQVIGVASKLDGPSLVLLEYPMGGGKTEAALYLADHLATAAGQKGVYFALPTMATSNQMFSRVRAYLGNRFPDTSINTQLLHGHASLNVEFELLRRASQRQRDQSGTQRHVPRVELAEIGESDETRLVASEWFTYRKRGLLAPYGVGTIDQALLAILQTKHFFVRLFGLAGKVVILDEVHAYDTYMRALLGRLLTWLAACGTSVVLLSATLPVHTRRDLLQAYAAGRGASSALPSESPIAYPRITWVTDHEAGALHVEGATHRSVALRTFTQTGDAWISELQSALREGGCAAVILNTVTRAQQVFDKLREHFAPDDVYLFHARYPFDERMNRERAVLAQFGPRSADRPHRAVVVATQVIEQSLDLDFDLMVTDLAPVDLVLQRSGRLWRHPRPWRPSGMDKPILWLLMPDCDGQGVPQFDSGSMRVYEPHTLLRSWLVLSREKSLEVPDRVEELIETVYQLSDPPETLPEPLKVYWRETRRKLQEEDRRDTQQAVKRYIPDVGSDLSAMTMDDLGEEEGDKHPALQALTRLGGPTATVICLVDEQGQLRTLGSSPRPIRLERRPDLEDIRALLGCSVSISFDPGLAKQILDLEPPATWDGSAYLRRCRLLRFDPSGQCLTADLPLRLDPVLGLMKAGVRKEEG